MSSSESEETLAAKMSKLKISRGYNKVRKLDSYTARAFHMERDPSAEPTVMGLLAFMERRALALENAEPATSASSGYGKQTRGTAVNLAAVGSKPKPACNYCPGASGESAQRASPEPRAAEPGGAA